MLQPASAQVAGPVKSVPPFSAETEIVVPVEACKEYEFELRFVTPAGGELGRIPDIMLPPLPDIEEYVPPPFTQVVKMNLLGGKLSFSTQTSSTVPASCLPRYLEAVDAYAARMEALANSEEGKTREEERLMGRKQDLVELTQEKILAKLGCVCTSPRLKMGDKIFLYQGQREGKPYYKEDLEHRSLPSSIPLTPVVQRSKREAFIGRVDGGSSSTTRRPWNYGGHGGSRGSSSGGSSSAGARRGSSSAGRGGLITGGLHGSRTPAPVATFLYWEPSARQWLIAPVLGSKNNQAEIASKPASTGLCPADTAQEWQTHGSRTRSGLTRTWTTKPGVTLDCKPDIGI